MASIGTPDGQGAKLPPERSMDLSASRLEDANLDLKAKLKIATEARDSVEVWCQAVSYSHFLEKFIPIFMKLLDGPPVFMSNLIEQRLRNCILEILHRLPASPSEALEPYAGQIVDKLMMLVRIENEDNAVLCLKTMMDFLRHPSKALVDKVQPLLDLIQEMFETMEKAVVDTFDNPSSTSGQPAGASTPGNSQFSQSPRPGSPVSVASAADIGGEQQQARPLLKGMQSFKVLAECPIIVVSLFQGYRNCVPRNVKAFVPLIKNILLLQAKPQLKAHEEAAAQGRVLIGVCKEIKNRAAFGDFITAQVKTMSFLAYLLRVYSQQLQDFLGTLPDIIVRLLRDCPREKSASRKELLVAIRHIINFNFRRIFLKKIDELLNERTLIGDGLAVYETMRPLAYSMLADLIHHLRDSLEKPQIRRTVEVYIKNLHDSFPGTSFQTMSAKLLLNMAECIAKLEPKQDARYFLIMILNAIGDKFATMNRQYHNAVKLSRQYSQPSMEITPENFMADKDHPPDWDEIDIFSAAPIKISNPRERNSDPIADNKFLFRNLLHGLKNLFYQLRQSNPPELGQEIDPSIAPSNWKEVSWGYNAEEVEVLIKLFREGAQVFRYYSVDKQTSDTPASPGEMLSSQSMTSSTKEEKELLETFATVFHHIDPATFHEVFQSEIPHLYRMMFDHAALLHVPQFLLASEATSPSFAGMLLQFLMDNIEDIGSADQTKSTILLRLFKLAFMAVTLFNKENEQVLLPHVSKIITKSIELSTTAATPMSYFYLLRSLFRSIGGGRFEQLYKEILPLLEMLLQVLNNLLLAARKPEERDLFVELSLTVPARLSNLLPHLSYLMRPLVVGLRAGSDLVGQGLRTLELCVDNLTADYLDPIMAPVIDELMAALHEHLKPNPYSHFHAHTTMRILGKLGGRNRKFLSGPPNLVYKAYVDDRPSFDIQLVGATKDRAFAAETGIDHAISKLTEVVTKPPAAKKADPFHKQQAFRFIVAQTKLLVGSDNVPEDFAQLVRLQANDLWDNKFDVGADLMVASEREKSIAKRDTQQHTMKKLLKACIFAVSLPELNAEASKLVSYLSRHFTMLEVGRALAQLKHHKKPFDVKAGEGPLNIESTVIADAIGESLSSDNADVRTAAGTALTAIQDAAIVIFGSAERFEKLPFFNHIQRLFCHYCYEEEWFVKSGGTSGIELMTKVLKFSDGWVMDRQIEFIRALLYVMKDMPLDISEKTRHHALDTLEALIRRCNKNTSKEDLKGQTKLVQTCALLVTELAHMNKYVRGAVQKMFEVLAAVTGAEQWELVAPVKERLLTPIYIKPLRALPFGTQIGHIDALTFCIKLGHGIVTFEDQLTRLLMETLALADADDETLAPRPHEQRSAEAIISLRVACIRLLSKARTFPEFSGSQPSQSTSRIIAVFFKSLYSKSPEVVDAAYAGLQGVLVATAKLPKDLLQSGLRPILMKLQDSKKLNVEGLDGLARLLKLLTTYFKVEIGSRLMIHMNDIAEPGHLKRTSFKLIEQDKVMNIITAILNVYHLLPPLAITFLGPVVKKVMELENSLRRTRSSPFRVPLIKYLNRYAKESWEHFIPLIKDHAKGRFFAQILDAPAAGPLRDVVVKDPAGFIDSFSKDLSDEERWPAIVNAIRIAFSLCKFSTTSDWLASNEDARKALLGAARELEAKLKHNDLPSELKLPAEQAGEQIMIVFTGYLGHEPQNLDFFFEIVDGVTADELRQAPVLFEFIYKHMISSTSVEHSRTLITRCIDLHAGRNTPYLTKTFAFRYIVNPIIAMDAQRNWDRLFGSAKGTTLVNKSLTETVHNKVWRPQTAADIDDAGQLGLDHYRMELLQMTTLLIKYHPNLIQDVRREVIKFGWNSIKTEDVISKHAAYVLIAFFIAQFDTPPKISSQVYQALLKAYAQEARPLVIQSLELLAPVLKKRIGGADPRYPMWAKLVKKVLVEEGTVLLQLQSVSNFLVRHPDLFYEARREFAQVIIPSLPKIAMPPTASTETKKLALNMVNLIWQWEERAAKEAGSVQPNGSPRQKRRADGSLAPSTPIPSSFVAPPAMRLSLLKYLVSFVCSFPERFPIASARTKGALSHRNVQPVPPPEACKMAAGLFRNFVSAPYWTDLNIDAMLERSTEETLTADPSTEEAYLTKALNTLEIVKIIVNVKSDEWVLNHLGQLQKLCDQPFKIENAEIQDALHNTSEADNKMKLQPLVKRILDSIPEAATDEEGASEEDSPGSEFISFCSTVANEALSNENHISAINILWSLCQRRPDEIDTHIPAIMKAFSAKLVRNHINAVTAGGTQPHPVSARPDGQNQAPPDPVEHEIQVGLIIQSIEILASRMSQLGDQRRPFLSVMASLIEKSPSLSISLKALDLVEGWIFNSTEPLPTLKEKVAVLHKMVLFENRADPTLLTKFLELVIRIYEDPKITRSELTVRMEYAFLIGTRAQDVDMRNRFITIFDRSMSRTVSSRLNYVISSQNWDTLAESYWISQVIQLMLGSVEMNGTAQLHQDDFRTMPASAFFGTYAKDSRLSDVMVDEQLENLITNHTQFCHQLGDVRVRDILEPLGHLQHTDSTLAHDIWVALFPLCWSALTKDDRADLEKGMVSLVTKDFHMRQIDKRPNCVQTLLEGAVRAKPKFRIPPHVVKYLARTYNVWYTAAVHLEESANKPPSPNDSSAVRESTLDALTEVYAGLQEDDLFYGTWRRRCGYVETNAALSYEQNGMWDKAQAMYENAQIKARTGALPFAQGEYMLWEDHWVICAQKLQQWEILADFAKHENFNDLFLESTYRNFEAWNHAEQREQLDSIIKAVSDAPTPRRAFFQAFMSLLKLHAKQESQPEFTRVCDEAIQLSIRKWHQLPKRVTNAHIPILQNFQQFVELHDASVICHSLSTTNAGNLDQKSQELKLLLGTWRERLPNFWDDINAWQDLVTWRQHIFQLVNGVYLHILPPQPGNATGNSYAYRGYHETAWIINRFAHVARKHNLPEVCIQQLNRIYTLPNIEIQEAFLKLREQAKCHYQNRSELNSGLDVINNTNLNYFGQQQKAEFYTLKGMFLNKLQQATDADSAFGSALYFDLKLPKAWAEWGYYSDSIFKQDPTNFDKASAAISCYLEASSLYKNAKSRKLLNRILWLLSLDNAEGTLTKTFVDWQGETPVWYWITFIPQLLTSLSRPEARVARILLTKLAKTYPQALYFQLRTSREDLLSTKKHQEAREARERIRRQAQQGQGQGSPAAKQASPDSRPQTSNGTPQRPGTAGGDSNQSGNQNSDSASRGDSNAPKQEGGQQDDRQETLKKPWERVDELMSAVKTAFPLLALSMETMVDQVQKVFKCPPDEDAYRLIVALFNDGLTYVGRSPGSYGQDVKLPQSTESNITRFAESVLPGHIRRTFEADFVVKSPTMFEYLQKLRKWRNRFEEKLDRRNARANLEGYSAHLSEFRFLKFDEIEIPGQYLEHRDKNQDFVRIERFMPNIDLVRGIGQSYRRVRLRGHDGSIHPFAIQHPAARHCRREERMVQLFRIFNGILAKRKESRRRNVQFHLPLAVPLSPSVRMVQDDPSYISLQGVYEEHCRQVGLSKDDPVLFTMEKMRSLSPKFVEQAQALKFETFQAVQEKFVPPTVALDFFQDTFPDFGEFWLFRRNVSAQLAALTFATYVMHMGSRYPHKMYIARGSGRVWGSELIPAMGNARAIFHNSEPVPFRLTPNLQTLMGPIATEGIFAPTIQAIARCLMEPDHGDELEMQLALFVRDEVAWWYAQQHRSPLGDGPNTLREAVQANAELIVRKVQSLGHTPGQAPPSLGLAMSSNNLPGLSNLPANQTIIDLISHAVNPQKLCQTDALWMAYL